RWDYFGGNYGLSSAEGTEIPGTRFFLVDGDASSLINDHNFFGGSWEGDGPEWHIDCAGAYCQWHSPRFETQTTDIKVRFRQVATSGEGRFNTIFAGRGTNRIVVTETGTAQSNHIYSALGSRLQTQGS